MTDFFTRARRLLIPYHVYNQGHKRDGGNPREVFLDDDDRRYFLSLIARHTGRSPAADRRGRTFQHLRSWLAMHAFCILTSHYHLLIWQKDERGIDELMNRVIGAYSRYFNAKYGNTQPLFSGRYCAVEVDSPEYFKWVVGYIHDNHPSGLDYEFSSHRAWVDPDHRPGWLEVPPAIKVFGGLDGYLAYLDERTKKKELDRSLGFGGRPRSRATRSRRPRSRTPR